MSINHITNENLMSTDFALSEKAAFLRSIPKPQPQEKNSFQGWHTMKGIWATDVAAMDRRSVKACLAGRGDWRVMWWQLNCFIHRLMKPDATLEQIMFSFHSRHHALTLLRLQTQHDYWQIFNAIKQHGLMAGLRCAVARAKTTRKEQP